MWAPLQDCGKQLTVKSRLREKIDDGYKLYEITEVEYDQYHLLLLSKNGQPGEGVSQVLKGGQMMEYGFEVEGRE
jgi:hypothetical protein